MADRSDDEEQITGVDIADAYSADLREATSGTHAIRDVAVGRAPVTARDFDTLPVRCLVRIFVTSVADDYIQPWNTERQRHSSATGFVIFGRRIVTNAHVVKDSVTVRVRRNGCTEKVSAKLLCVGHDPDLAILTVDDPKFWESVVECNLLQELPALGAEVPN
jgi:S1-C subfamily serine protease